MKQRAVIERITYQNGENGYSILKARVKGYDDLVTLVGNMLDVTVGTVLVADGQWKVHRQYGSQFVVESYEEAMPATLFGLEKYLGSGLVKGIGLKFSKLIVAKFGMDTFDIIEHDSKRLAEVDGIVPKRIRKIHDSWMKQLDIKDVMVFLQGNGVSTAYAAKIPDREYILYVVGDEITSAPNYDVAKLKEEFAPNLKKGAPFFVSY